MLQECIAVNDTGMGWLPQGIEHGDYPHYLFDVDVISDEPDSIEFNCWTKWAPPLQELEQIAASMKGVKWSIDYEESGMGIYGRHYYEGGISWGVELTGEDLNRVVYDDELDEYIFDGKFIETEFEAYETILNEKEAKA